MTTPAAMAGDDGRRPLWRAMAVGGDDDDRAGVPCGRSHRTNDAATLTKPNQMQVTTDNTIIDPPSAPVAAARRVPVARLQVAYQLWRAFGSRWLLYRLQYAFVRRSGWLARRTPARPWAAQPLAGLVRDPALVAAHAYLNYRRTQAPPFFPVSADRFRDAAHFAAWDQAGADPRPAAAQIGQGRFCYFAQQVVDTGFPPDWHRNPFSGRRLPADKHWSLIDDFAAGDIKIVWEPGRFAFAYTLVRAYRRSGDNRYAEWFWQLFEDWRLHNPPNRGAHWKCGQEIALRALACCFALYGLLDAPATTAARVTLLAEMLARSAERIAANIDYALSQRNNHGVSEAAGLFTIGSLFPELRGAARWQARGRALLERLAGDLIAADGSFTQHSPNYHRVMLHALLWSLQLAELQRRPFSLRLRQQFQRAVAFLYRNIDQSSGYAPVYGPNDGALILPLDGCDYRDMRPVVQAGWYYCTGQRCFAAGPWDEPLLWLFGAPALATPVAAPVCPSRAPASSYYALRGADHALFVRCGPYPSRPIHADLLHVDLWWRGQNIALDAGTYSYNAPPPWDGALAETGCHNTVSVDGQDQMDRRGRFLWLPWARGQVQHHFETAGGLIYWEGEHDGYQRLAAPVTHRRALLRLGAHGWLVLDALTSAAPHSYRLHWLLADLPQRWQQAQGRLTLVTPAGPYHLQVGVLRGSARSSLVRADQQTTRGWSAPYYNDRRPALSLALVAETTNVVFYSLFSPAAVALTTAPGQLHFRGDQWHTKLQLAMNSARPLITAVTGHGLTQPA